MSTHKGNGLWDLKIPPYGDALAGLRKEKGSTGMKPEFVPTTPEFEKPPLEALEQQAVEGAMHTHSVHSRLADRIHTLESMLYGLVDLLVDKQLVGESDLTTFAARVAETIEQRGERAHGGVALRIDPPGEQNVTTVNCAERMPICKAICCRLSFPLTADEVQQGQLKWDLGQPYFMRHDERGACVHQDRSSGSCGVYTDRPGVCRRYSCANDKRIWKDFDGMVLNQEWLDENLGPKRPQLIQIRMDRVA